ncbi:MAG TPA: ABC transporter permease [Vicinamibacterales bacterium]|nr:ABC transporter permease [Vicinamibacterales bacterium]
MNRVFTVAQMEFLQLVRTKAFLIGILMMPVLMALAIGFQVYAARHTDTEVRTFAVIDHSGTVYDALAAAAAAHNTGKGEGEAQTGPHFVPSRVDAVGGSLDTVKLDLSDRVRSDDLFAFIEIPAGIIDGSGDAGAIRYYTGTPSYEPLPDWIRDVANREIARQRFTNSGIDPALVTKLNARVPVSSYGLVDRQLDGSVGEARETDAIATFVMPFVFLFLMFMSVMTGAQHLLNAIVEEKMSKISEVLVGSIEPFKLLMGKLLGVTAVSFLLASIYFAGGIFAIVQSGRFDLLRLDLFAWFFLFLLCAVLMYGSIFLALGSACSDLKDAQSMMQPAILLIMLPYLASFAVIRAPDSSLATGLSLVPTVTPFIMMMRLAMPPGPPLWQVLLSVGIVLVTTTFLVWAAGRIFRVGILMQGKAPNLPEVLRWIRA